MIEGNKPFQISKRLVWEAFKRVKASAGAGGADQISIADYEQNLRKNLYRLWNRLSSGSYFPSPVRCVDIPKAGGKSRRLGIPTVEDRIAQMTAVLLMQPQIEPKFHADSFGYRPGKSAHHAIEMAKVRCWKNDWVLEIDIKGFFDNMDHDLILKAVNHFSFEPWVSLYVERWLKVPMIGPNGDLQERTKGTPQGGVISPLLANLFLHFSFDLWMSRQFPSIVFERYADDIIVHCRTRQQAEELLCKISSRLLLCQLETHPEKTKIVYCKDARRKLEEEGPTSFEFLGFEFRRRTARGKFGPFDGYLPALSPRKRKAIQAEIKSWRIHRLTCKSLKDLARIFNPTVRGWYNYYGRFYISALNPIYWQIQKYLTRWAEAKYKGFRNRRKRAYEWLLRMMKRQPRLFAHWSGRNRNFCERSRAV